MKTSNPDLLDVWQTDDYGVLNLHTRTPSGLAVHAHISPRPSYCDRGHWHVNVNGPLELDDSDRFPRYYFSLSDAVTETEKFLRWRIHRAREPVERIEDAAGRRFTK